VLANDRLPVGRPAPREACHPRSGAIRGYPGPGRQTHGAQRRGTPGAISLHPVSAPVPAVLSIAGSDSGAGAGIQADLKAFAACGVHGMTALTALTAQNTLGVSAVHTVSPAFIVEQVRSVQDDIGVDAVKIGMLGTAATVAAVTEALDLLDPGTPVVIDPVMVAESGAVLLDEPARDAMIELLLPRATVITPNLPEARVLARGADDLVRALHALGPANVVITGGHRDEATDLFFDGDELHELPGERYPDGAAHGSGCTHSSALAAHLALGFSPLEAARAAKALAAEAVRNGLRTIGRGPGPVDALHLASRRAPVGARPLS
jgi:hydroxymethylpyrimidine/phosphomethylpyrimidine kinase